jgi:glucose/arabinose dehydrogenase
MRIEEFEILFEQTPEIAGPNHFGSRIVFDTDGRILLALGERFQFEPAQDVSNTLGTVVRLNADGTIPEDNPFVGRDGEDAIWSYGHRNIQAAALHPETGRLYVAEMGPLGGDELNIPEPGANYGWPLVSHGINYDGSDIPDPSTEPDFADAIHTWSPTISPSGMAFYTGDVFPDWQGSALIGSLSQDALIRVAIDGESVTSEEFIPLGARVRDVAQGPDGLIYLLTDQDDGKVWRLAPLPEGSSRMGE